MLRRTLTIFVAAALALGSSGCGSFRAAERGALIGAGIGLFTGALLDEHEPARGAVIGAAAGALGGYVIGREVEDHDGHHGRGYGYGAYEDGYAYHDAYGGSHDRGYGHGDRHGYGHGHGGGDIDCRRCDRRHRPGRCR
jgi:hypothetical protein